jgi:hypothetical protein
MLATQLSWQYYLMKEDTKCQDVVFKGHDYTFKSVARAKMNKKKPFNALVKYTRGSRKLVILMAILVSIGAMLIWPSSDSAISDSAMLSKEELAIVSLPFNTTLSADRLSADRRTYCHGTYGISDIGNLRIAVKGLVFSGTSTSSSIKVGSSAKWYQRLLWSIRPNRGGRTSSRGSTGHGKRRFTYASGGKQGKTVCTFGGIEFSFVDNRAIFGNKAVSFAKPTTVFLSLEGNAEKIFRE